MTLSRACCCDGAFAYYVLEPCYNETVSAKKYMSASAFASCGFSEKLIYENDYCGYFRGSNTTADTLDETCSNYFYVSSGCCGGTCGGDTFCCGYHECMENRKAAGKSPPLVVTGFQATTGTAGTSWTVAVNTVSAGNPEFYSAGTSVDIRYLVAGTATATFLRDGSGTIDCNGAGRPAPVTVPFKFYVQHRQALSCFTTQTSIVGLNACDSTAAVCPGTTTTTGSGFTACDAFNASPGNANQTLLTNLPAFGNDCSIGPLPYRIRVAIGVVLGGGQTPAAGGCVAGCTNTGQWSGAYFPDTYASFELVLAGAWQ